MPCNPFLAICVLLILNVVAASGQNQPTRVATNPTIADAQGQQIQKWIDQLDSPSYEQRERATAALIKTGRPALKLLTETILKRKSEQAFRCAHILEEIGANADEATQLKVVRLFYFLGDAGFSQIHNDSSEFREKWQAKRRLKVFEKLKSLGVNIAAGHQRGLVEIGGPIIVLDGGFEAVAIDDDWEKIKKRDLDKSKNRKTNKEAQQATHEKNDPAQERVTKIAKPSIESILLAGKDADEKAVLAIEDRHQPNKQTKQSTVGSPSADPDELLRAVMIDRAGAWVANDFANSAGHQISINENTKIKEAIPWLKRVEKISSFTVTGATVTNEFVKSFIDRSELKQIRFAQCQVESKSLHELGKQRPDISIKVVGNAMVGVHGPSDRKSTDMKNSQCKISQVVEGSAADEAGIEVDDLIIEIEGFPIKTFRDLVFEIAGRKAGDQVELKIVRNGVEKSVMLTLKPR